MCNQIIDIGFAVATNAFNSEVDGCQNATFIPVAQSVWANVQDFARFA